MRKIAFAGAMALAASTMAANPALGQVPAAAAPAQSPAHQAAARDFAEAIAPDSSVEQQVDTMIKQMFDQLFSSDPDFAEMEKEYPGLRMALVERIRPVMIKSALQVMPRYRADLTKLYGDNLTTEELREATAFFRSPEMLAFMASVRRNLKFDRTTASALQEKDITQADLQGDVRSSAMGIMAELTPQQREKLTTFFSSALGRKIAGLNPQKLAINAKWFNYSSPEAEKELEVAMVSGMIDHVAKTDPEMADEMRKSLKPDGTLPD